MGVKVKERKKGEWWIYINHQGKRKAKKVGDKRTAQEVAKKIQAKLALGEFDLQKEEKSKTPLFKDYASLWLDNFIKGVRRDSTHERYKHILEKHVVPTLGNKHLDEITRGEIRNLLLGLHKKGYSKSTVGLVRDVLSGPLGHAVDDEIIPANPVTGILKRLKLESDRKLTVEPFTPEEVNLFLETCHNHRPEHYSFFLCAFRTGMRLGELLALHWGDVDFNSRFIHIQRSYRRGKVEPPKNGKTRRVDMSDQLATTLKALLTTRKKEALQKGLGEPVEIIFHRDSQHMEQNYIRRVFKRMLQKAGMREMRPHDIRHTFASLLLTNGESPVYTKEQLGHSSIQMTVDIYGHLIPSSNRDAVNKLDNPQPNVTHTQPAQKERL